MYGYAEEQNIVIVSYIKKNVFVFTAMHDNVMWELQKTKDKNRM